MALAAKPAATWLLEDTVEELVAVIRHSCTAFSAHQLTPIITDHWRATR